MKEEILLLEYKKRCPCCGEHGGKDGRGFYKNRSRKDGLNYWCIVCEIKKRCEYLKTEKGKQCLKRYNQSEKRKQAQRRYRQTEKGRIAKRKYRQGEKQKQAQKHYRQTEKGRIMKNKCMKNAVIKLSDSYIKSKIKRTLLKKIKDITPEDILIKREHMQAKRILNRIRKELTL